MKLPLDVELGVNGCLARAAVRLAETGISIITPCGFLKDHLLVRSSDSEKAREIISDLVWKYEEAK